jgi:hypothetical protein
LFLEVEKLQGLYYNFLEKSNTREACRSNKQRHKRAEFCKAWLEGVGAEGVKKLANAARRLTDMYEAF